MNLSLFPAGSTGAETVRPQPILRWAGSKSKSVEIILKYAPTVYERYFEPFAGSLAIFCALENRVPTFISDSNVDLINFYRILRDEFEALVNELDTSYRFSKDLYYEVRSIRAASLPPVERAARFYYLNRYCWNGLFRVNRQGQFNVPIGKFSRTPVLYRREELEIFRDALAGVDLAVMDYRTAVKRVGKGDFLYVDPPYDSSLSSPTFAGYSSDDFPRDEHRRLCETLALKVSEGAFVLASNADTEFIRAIYQSTDQFAVKSFKISREINSRSERRSIGARELLFVSKNILSDELHSERESS